MVTLLKKLQRSVARKLFLYHLLKVRLVSTKCLALYPVNHTGTLNREEYTAFIKERNTSSWLFYNDAAVCRLSMAKTNNTSSYIYIYEAI